MKTSLRTYTCGELSAKQVGKQVKLAGWVNARRDHGGIIFIDLRGRYGLTQVRFDPRSAGKIFKLADSLRAEYVVQITGEVILRPKGMHNEKLKTGEIEVNVQELIILNKSKTPPFVIDRETKNLDEDIRLKYRYLDLRHTRLLRNLELRANIVGFASDWLRQKKFMHVETPIMGRETPEGARDYLVPSRLYPGEFYALAQSPQQYKQLLMVAGIDRYFQFAHVFRDEDPRANRVPEHTQLDLEMSFVDREDIMNLVEELMKELSRKFSGAKIDQKFLRLTYEEAMQKYGSDKPDLRFEMQLVDVTEITRSSKFAVFSRAASVQVIAAPIAHYSRKEFDDLTKVAKNLGAAGLAWIAWRKEGFISPITKFFSEAEIIQLSKAVGAKPGDALLFAANSQEKALTSLGALRAYLGEKLKLADPRVHKYVWIYDFPMFVWNAEEKRIDTMHHMFVQPYTEHLDHLVSQDKDKILQIKANLFDLVLNGQELCSGSLRIWQAEIQRQVMQIIGISKHDMENKFGHMLQAFEYGAPPHGGVGLGLDRIVSIFAKENSIREVIAFPLNAQARDPMTGAPSMLSDKQLKELHLKIIKKSNK